MDSYRFDEPTRSLTVAGSRRRALAAALGGLITLGALSADAERVKRTKKKPKLNAFGCLNVGQPCRGKDAKCCSGVCEGMKPKKGEKNKSSCVAHNIGGCTIERSSCVTGNQSSLCGPQSLCLATTGNASFCADVQPSARKPTADLVARTRTARRQALGLDRPASSSIRASAPPRNPPVWG